MDSFPDSTPHASRGWLCCTNICFFPIVSITIAILVLVAIVAKFPNIRIISSLDSVALNDSCAVLVTHCDSLIHHRLWFLLISQELNKWFISFALVDCDVAEKFKLRGIPSENGIIFQLDSKLVIFFFFGCKLIKEILNKGILLPPIPSRSHPHSAASSLAWSRCSLRIIHYSLLQSSWTSEIGFSGEVCFTQKMLTLLSHFLRGNHRIWSDGRSTSSPRAKLSTQK